jgi:hypothetical protein
VLDCDYFEPIWVIQEIVMATSPIIVICKGSLNLYQFMEDLMSIMNAAGLRYYLHSESPGGWGKPRAFDVVIKLKLARDM